MELQIYTDGGSLRNPGQAAYAFVVFFKGVILYQFSQRIGTKSNNAAEYEALLQALTWVKQNSALYYGKDNACTRIPLRFFTDKNKDRLRIAKLACFSDSSLMVNQLNGLFKVKNAQIREFVLKIRVIEQEIQTPITYAYIPREQNGLADSLVKKELFRL